MTNLNSTNLNAMVSQETENKAEFESAQAAAFFSGKVAKQKFFNSAKFNAEVEFAERTHEKCAECGEPAAQGLGYPAMFFRGEWFCRKCGIQKGQETSEFWEF